MPIYEFRCIRCDNLFDKLQSPNDDEPDCPICGSDVLRIFSITGLRFKGTGFHVTDYGRRGPKRSINARDS